MGEQVRSFLLGMLEVPEIVASGLRSSTVREVLAAVDTFDIWSALVMAAGAATYVLANGRVELLLVVPLFAVRPIAAAASSRHFRLQRERAQRAAEVRR